MRSAYSAVENRNANCWLDAGAANPRAERSTGNCSGEICDNPLACKTSRRTAPSLITRMWPANRVAGAGHIRVINEGAVRLEVLQASGLSQISPEQFPVDLSARGLAAPASSQQFAFRFSTAEYALRIQADNVLPEVSASELLEYHSGETE